MTNELVSIVLPVYNGERYLSQAIDSILAQTFKNIELIIVNDCSTDDTDRIVLDYLSKDNRIKYLKNDKNMKLPASLNIGFKCASGKYLTWTSDDNFFEKTAIEKMVCFLEQHKQYDLVCCKYKVIYENECKEPLFIIPNTNIMCVNNIGACFLYTSYIAKKVGEYNTKLFLVEDYDYWLRISDVGKIGVLDDCLYTYRMHQASLTQSKSKKIKKTLFDYQYKIRLKEYNKKKISKDKMCIFIDYLIKFKQDGIFKCFWILKFSLKYPYYFSWRSKKRKEVRKKT